MEPLFLIGNMLWGMGSRCAVAHCFFMPWCTFGLPGCFSAGLIDFCQLFLRSCWVLCVTYADLV